jgi:hypothetical protein
MAVTVLQEEKQRSYDHYQESFAKTKEQIVARLRHPSGQLALLNPPRAGGAVTPLHPVVLPFSRYRLRRPEQGPPRGGNGRLPGAVPELRQPVRRHRQQPLGGRLRLRWPAPSPARRWSPTASATSFSTAPTACGWSGQPARKDLPLARAFRTAWLNRRPAARGLRGRFTGYVELEDPAITTEPNP